MIDSYWMWDEMNIIETPFCMLNKRHTKRNRFELSPGGSRYLVNRNGNRLPGPLAELIVLGLLWMTMEKTEFEERGMEHKFSLRELIKDYMYPNRQYWDSGWTIREVETELKILGETVMVSPKWFDQNKGRHVEVCAPIFSSVKIWGEGGNSRKMAKIVWGPHIESSALARYTTKIDDKIWRQIEYPVDRRLFRLLNRQLAQLPEKKRHLVKSCQNFARFKMTMQGNIIERGGRTASSYIVKRLGESLKRLQGFGLAVRMVVDRSRRDFSIVFERIPGVRNEAQEEKYSKYREALIAQAEKELGSEEAGAIRKKAEQEARESGDYAFRGDFESAQQVSIRIRMREMLFERSNGMGKDEFLAQITDEQLEKALVERHGYNPLKEIETEKSRNGN